MRPEQGCDWPVALEQSELTILVQAAEYFTVAHFFSLTTNLFLLFCVDGLLVFFLPLSPCCLLSHPNSPNVHVTVIKATAQREELTSGFLCSHGLFHPSNPSAKILQNLFIASRLFIVMVSYSKNNLLTLVHYSWLKTFMQLDPWV